MLNLSFVFFGTKETSRYSWPREIFVIHAQLRCFSAVCLIGLPGLNYSIVINAECGLAMFCRFPKDWVS